MIPRLLIAGTHSSSVQPSKVGPDYIDPTYHTLSAGRPCRNLDTWMVPLDWVCALFAHAVREADIAISEGMMVLYDGFGYEDEVGSATQVAKPLRVPAILVLDASRMARSAAALALGYQQFDSALPLAGFIVNRAGCESHGQRFHYSVWEGRPANLPPAYELLPPWGEGEPWPEGAQVDSLWASYVHVHFWGKPELAVRFVEACRQGETVKGEIDVT